MLIRSGLILVKYWFSISDDEQERRFQARLKNPLKQWKLSPMDLESRICWVEYSQAKDEMFSYTDTRDSPWWVVNAEEKKRARLNMIHHLLSMIPYEDVLPKALELPPRPPDKGYVRPPIESQTFIPEIF
jgi:polyphosphate kinase 2 (PPK2 family)